MSPRTRARGSLHLVPLTQILVPLHHLLCSPPPLSPPSMTHRSLSQCRPALTLSESCFLFGFQVPPRMRTLSAGVWVWCAGRPGTDWRPLCSTGAGQVVPWWWWWAPKSRAVPENLRFHSRNVCQRPHTSALILMQSARAYCTPSIRRSRKRKRKVGQWTAPEVGLTIPANLNTTQSSVSFLVCGHSSVQK